MSTTFQIAEVAQRSGFTAAAGPQGRTPGCRYDGEDGEAPIACVSAAGETPIRVEEWQTLLEDERHLHQGVTARHGLDNGLRLGFASDTDVTEIAHLAAEQSCCRCFRFALVIDDRGIALEVHAPPDGLPVLTALLGAAA